MDKEYKPIVCEKDLAFYERKLCDMKPTNSSPETKSMYHHLMQHKGKLIKAEVVSNGCAHQKIGLLMDVGEDFIVIRIGNSAISTVIPMKNLHCVTVMHRNYRF